MIRTTGFKRAFLMPTNRRPRSPYIPGTTFPGSFTSHGWLRNMRSFNSSPYHITSHHVFTNRVFDRMIPSQPRYNVKLSTFQRLFLLPWKNNK